MKFFKHFTDAHRGASMHGLFEKMSHTGIACYWTLVEMCAEKLEKERDEECTEAHCHFSFHEKILRQNLRISRTNVELFLGFCAGFSLLSFEITNNEIKIYMPKLLECLDRDAKRARPHRGQVAPKIKIKKKIKNIKKESDDSPLATAFLNISARYLELFPGTTLGPKAFERFESQMSTPKSITDLENSLPNYRAVLDANTWRSPKQTFAAYLGTEKSGYFWHDYITAPKLDNSQTGGYG